MKFFVAGVGIGPQLLLSPFQKKSRLERAGERPAVGRGKTISVDVVSSASYEFAEGHYFATVLFCLQNMVSRYQKKQDSCRERL
jgi:hypothetical protein